MGVPQRVRLAPRRTTARFCAPARALVAPAHSEPPPRRSANTFLQFCAVLACSCALVATVRLVPGLHAWLASFLVSNRVTVLLGGVLPLFALLAYAVAATKESVDALSNIVSGMRDDAQASEQRLCEDRRAS